MSESIKLLLSLSLSGTILAGILFLLKPFIKNKVSKSIQYYIWLVVLLRLVLPFSFESSLMNDWFYSDSNKIEVQNGEIEKSAVAPLTDEQVIKPIEGSAIPNVQKNVEMDVYKNDIDHTRYIQDSLNQYAMYLWIFGIVAMILFNVFGYLHFSRKLKISNKEAMLEENNLLKELLKGKYKRLKLKRNSSINTPMLIGIINPSILIPDNIYSMEQLRNILNHEITHLKRKDIIIKWFVMFVSAIHWFNPFMHFIKKEINSACELACDEAVINNLSENEKQSYGETLISVVSEQNCPNGMLQATMCEEKKSLKERLLAIMKHKKKSKLVIVLSAVLLIVAVGGAVFLGAGIGVVEKEPPNLYLGYEDKESKVAITGTYGWKWSGGAIQSDSPIPYEFDFNENNILSVAQGSRIEINFKAKNDLNSKNYDYEIVEGRLYKNQKEILYKPLPNIIDGKMTIITPLVEGEYVCSLLVDFKNKGKVTYGFIVKVVDSSTLTYRSKYGWEINYPKDMDMIGENFISKSKTNKYLSFKVIEDIPEDKVDGVLNGEIKRILGGNEGTNTIKESLKKVKKDGLIVYSFSHNSQIESKTTLIKHTYIYDEKNIYMFNGQIPDLTEEEYENIVNSFKIVDKKIQNNIEKKSNVDFKIITSPDKYTPAMSFIPGIAFLVEYNGAVDKFIYSVNGGSFLVWNNTTGKISEQKNEFELETNETVYWTPLQKDSDKAPEKAEVAVTLLKDGKTIGEKRVHIISDAENKFYSVDPSDDVIATSSISDYINKPRTIYDAVANAIKKQGDSYARGEVVTEGHIVLDAKEKDNNVIVYTVASVGTFGFENGIFTKISGSGAIPTVIILKKDDDNSLYSLVEYKEPMDGAGYTDSIKEMFPKELWDEVFEKNQSSYEELKKQQEEQAREYLDSIGISFFRLS